MKKWVIFGALCAAVLALSVNSAAQDKPAATPPLQGKPPATVTRKAAAPVMPAPGSNGKTIEEIIARVNNEIITRSEYERAKASAEDDAKQECAGKCTPDQLRADIDERQKNILRDLIDQSLLVQRGKDMGVSVEPEVIKKLDQIRIQNNLNSMEDLEKAVSAQGLNWEDFKNNIRNNILTQKVVSQEVGSHINIGESDARKYYEEHKTEFVRPEQVALREIIVNTEGKKDSDLP